MGRALDFGEIREDQNVTKNYREVSNPIVLDQRVDNVGLECYIPN